MYSGYGINMRCHVPFCISNSKTRGKSHGITFHNVPKDPKIRKRWVKAVGIKDCGPRCKYNICSEHFAEKSIFETKAGPRIHVGAFPKKQNFDEPAAFTVCRICLTMDSNMHHLREFQQVFKRITGLSPTDGDAERLPQVLCWECAARLTTAATLRDKALLSDVLLRDLLKEDTFIKVRDVKRINRKSYGLKTSLVQTLYDAEHFDLKVQDIFRDTDHVDTPDLDIKYDPDDEIPGILQDDTENEEITNTNQHENTENNDKTFMLQTVTKDLKEKHNISQNVPTEVMHQDENVKRVVKTIVIPNENTEDNVKYVMLQNDNRETNAKYVMLQNKNAESNVKYVMLQNDGGENNLKYVMLQNDEENSNVNSFIAQNDYYNMETGETSIIIQDHNEKPKKQDLKRVRFFKEESESSDEEIVLPAIEEKDVQITKKATPNKTVCRVRQSRAKKENAVTVLGPLKKNTKKIPIDESLFKITMLTYSQQKQEIIERQEKPSYTHALFKCTICFTGFTSEGVYERHIEKHTDICGPYECSICKIRKKRKWVLNIHVAEQHTREYRCVKCDFVTRHRNRAVEHMRYHAGHKYPCKLCPRVFDKRTSYFSHQHQSHKFSTVCNYCGFTFVSELGLTSHKTRQHKSEKDLELKGPYCSPCDVTFFSQEAYDRHLSLSAKHMENEPDSNHIRNDHEYSKRTRSEKHEPLSCEQCNQVLRSYKAYAMHFKHHHPGQSPTQFPRQRITYICEECGAIFSTTKAFKSHRWVHKNAKPYQCDRCPKSFSQIARFETHMNDHNSVQPRHQCPHCDKFFGTAATLKKHVFNHTGLKPYKCDFCDKSFSSTDRVRSHIQHVHFKKPWPRKANQKAKRDILNFLE